MKFTSVEIEKLIGIPFRHLGRDVTGLDCYGLVRLFHPALPDFCYPEKPRIADRIGSLDGYYEPVDAPACGDVLIFANHLGVYLGDDRFIHVSRRRGCEIKRLRGMRGFLSRVVRVI